MSNAKIDPILLSVYARTFRSITDEVIPHVRDYRPDVPPALDAAIYRALSRNREERDRKSVV